MYRTITNDCMPFEISSVTIHAFNSPLTFLSRGHPPPISLKSEIIP